MHKDIKKKWLKALRSGEYEQGTDELRSDFGMGQQHCCLGVLCDLFSKQFNSSWDELRLKDEVLPSEVRDWAGLNDSNPKVYAQGVSECISSFNDGENDEQLNFNQIADLIEAQL